jgi:hypothetical protein
MIIKSTFNNGQVEGKSVVTFSDKASPYSLFTGYLNYLTPSGGVLEYVNGDRYTGELGENMERKGKGEMIYADGGNGMYTSYSGEWADNTFNGQGILQYLKENSIYDGQFVNGKRHGKGVLTIHSKFTLTKFFGTFHEDRPIRGKYVYHDGSFYIGDLKEGKRHGQGSYQFVNGDQYSGQFEEGEIEGVGLLVSGQSDELYSGEFHCGKKHGEGEFRTSNFDYMGKFRADKMEGQGTLVMKQSKVFSSYTGGFKDNYPEGQGVLFYRNKCIFTGKFEEKAQIRPDSRYTGEYELEDLDAVGTMTMPDGSSYTGALRRGKYLGMGKLVWVAGEFTYQGMFSDGLMSGPGKIQYKNGDVIECEMRNDEPKTGTLHYRNGDVYKGPFANFLPEGEGVKTFRNHPVIHTIRGFFVLGKPSGRHECTLPNSTDKMQLTFNEQGLQNGYGEHETSQQKITGDFVNYRPQGRGEIIYKSSRSYYKGPIRNGIPWTDAQSGEGQYWFGNVDPTTWKPCFDKGSKWYTGGFVEGRMSGRGTVVYPSGDRYTGEVTDCTPNGEGTLAFHNGDSYTGRFTMGEIVSNAGVYTFSVDNADGFMAYTGEYQKNKFHGKGILKMKDGSVYRGLFKGGLRHGKGELTINDKIIFKGGYENGLKEGKCDEGSIDGGTISRNSYKSGKITK